MSYKDRIALNFLLATAVLMALAFFMVYIVVYTNVYKHLDNDLEYEAYKHEKEVIYRNSDFIFINKKEWEEREHREVQVNPVFIQLMDHNWNISDKSPNLKTDSLFMSPEIPPFEHHTATLQEKPIRQVYIPLRKDGNTEGYLIAAIPLEDAQLVISSLRKILLTTYPLILLLLFFSTRMLAGRSIKPVQAITSTADMISRKRLNERIPLPETRDELYTLTRSINDLLERIESAMNREKQFTSDASHELRTPLSVMKGTLEVLIRKPRTNEEYKAKITEMIGEIDRMAVLVDQLLLLARFDNLSSEIQKSSVSLNEIVDESIYRRRSEIEKSNLSVRITDPENTMVITDPMLLRIAVDNLISNAIKYSQENQEIHIELFSSGAPHMLITNNGISVSKAERALIFQPFYRGSASFNKQKVNGQGLGLSITQKICELLNISVSVLENGKEDEVTFQLIFNESIK